MNDVTTDLQDPPTLGATPYPETFVALVQETYPELTTLQLTLAPRPTMLLALEAARDMGLSFSAP